MRVHWTENAIEHLVNIYEYIAFNSPTFIPTETGSPPQLNRQDP